MLSNRSCFFLHHWFKKLLLEGGGRWQRDLWLPVLTCGQVAYISHHPNLGEHHERGGQKIFRSQKFGETAVFGHDGAVAWTNYRRLWLPSQTCRISRPPRVLHGWRMGVPRACPRWETPGSWRILGKCRMCPPEGVRGEYDQYALFENIK